VDGFVEHDDDDDDGGYDDIGEIIGCGEDGMNDTDDGIGGRGGRIRSLV